jgi:hypothetical protein
MAGVRAVDLQPWFSIGSGRVKNIITDQDYVKFSLAVLEFS